MARIGKQGGDGPVPDNIRIYCETRVRETFLPKMLAYAEKHPVTAKDWHWCYEQFVRISGLLDNEDASGTPQEDGLRMLK